MNKAHTYIAIALITSLTAASQTSADTINIAFHNGGTTEGGMTTRPDGTVVQTSNDTWNNVTNNGGVGLTFSGFSLLDSDGVDSGADLAGAASSSGFNSNGWGGNNQDRVMMEGYYGLNGADSLDVTGLSSSYTALGYKVVVYGDSNANPTMNYTIGSVTETINDGGTFTNDFGPYSRSFYHVNGSSFSLTGNLNGADPESAVSGIQIIANEAGKALIDIGSNQGTPTSPDGNGNHWNTADTADTAYDLTNTDGGNTNWTLTISVTGSGGTGFTGSPLGASPAPGDFNIASAYNDGIFNNSPGNGVHVLTYEHLDPTQEYELEFWGDRSSGWIDGDLTLTTGTSLAGSDFLLEQATLLTIVATPDANGVLEFEFDEIDNSMVSTLNSVLNVMSIQQIESVVIPAPAALPAGLAMLALAAARRKRHTR